MLGDAAVREVGEAHLPQRVVLRKNLA